MCVFSVALLLVWELLPEVGCWEQRTRTGSWRILCPFSGCLTAGPSCSLASTLHLQLIDTIIWNTEHNIQFTACDPKILSEWNEWMDEVSMNPWPRKAMTTPQVFHTAVESVKEHKAFLGFSCTIFGAAHEVTRGCLSQGPHLSNWSTFNTQV